VLSDAAGGNGPMAASPYTDFGGFRVYYIFAFLRGTSTMVTVWQGSAEAVDHDPATRMFTLDVLPNSGGSATISLVTR
jgi:hypothetical protein